MKWKTKYILIFGILVTILSTSFVLSACFGFVKDGNCYGVGNELRINGTYYYVDANGNLQLQKQDGVSCQNNFECLNNLCSYGKCVNLYKEVKDKGQIVESIHNQNITTCGNNVCDSSIGENENNCPNDCMSFKISIATLNDTYAVGEQIKLTDPPEDKNFIFEKIFQFFIRIKNIL